MARSSASFGLTVGLVTFFAWALAAGSLVYWAWLAAGPQSASPVAGSAGPAADLLRVDTRQVARALGATESRPVQEASADVLQRVKLRGVLTHGSAGAALIAVDGEPARTVRVGGLLDGLDSAWTLRAVGPHSVVVAQGAREAKLEMPPLDQRSRSGDAKAPQALPGVLPVPPAPQTLPGVLPVPPAPRITQPTGSEPST